MHSTGMSVADLMVSLFRHRPGGTTKDQPAVWTNIDFEVSEAGAGKLAEILADVLDQPGWYADFRSEKETFVVYHGRVFRYPRGDAAGRAEAQAYGREHCVPGPQLDWPI
jgi:hypothetical protein